MLKSTCLATYANTWLKLQRRYIYRIYMHTYIVALHLNICVHQAVLQCTHSESMLAAVGICVLCTVNT
jgi:hypothetical protein